MRAVHIVIQMRWIQPDHIWRWSCSNCDWVEMQSIQPDQCDVFRLQRVPAFQLRPLELIVAILDNIAKQRISEASQKQLRIHSEHF